MHTAQDLDQLPGILLAQPCIRDGLNEPYSPNHTSGQTTTQHVATQMEMLTRLRHGDYAALQAMVANPNGALTVSAEELKDVLAPMAEQFGSSEWMVLTLVVAYHDLGKMEAAWANEHGLDTTGVEWLAHDYDSKGLLVANPGLLTPYSLDEKEREAVLELCRLHSVPGQFFFGEGSLAAYEGLRHQHPFGMTMGRTHGLLDVMSALNHGFVRPILESHRDLGELVAKAQSSGRPLDDVFRDASEEQFEKEVDSGAPVGAVSWRRLRRLLGKRFSPENLNEALTAVPAEFVTLFDLVSDGDHTWYGTYIANAFGSGLLAALDGTSEAAGAVGLLVKAIACAGRRMEHRKEWTVSALEPSLQVKEGRDGALAVLRSLAPAETLEQAYQLLDAGPLRYKVGDSGVEFSWQA